VPAVPSSIIEPIWDQVSALLPAHEATHPLGCHRRRIADRVVFDKLVQVLVFGCAYARIADATCSATTLRRRRDEWIAAGVIDTLHALTLAAYDRMIGLALEDLAVDCCMTKAPCGGEVAGRSPVDRGKQGLKRSLVVDAAGIPLATIAAPANRHDAPLLEPTLDALTMVDQPLTIHLDRGYDSRVTRERLASRGMTTAIAPKGQPASRTAHQRWVVERTHAWTNAHKKLVWCTERRARVVAFWITFSAVIITVGRLVREAWARYRWASRPPRRP
jgi:transposase